jgi:hypothetical protein
MTALVTAETAVLVVLGVLVAGLLRGYAAVLQRLHALEGADRPAAAPPFRTAAGIPGPAVPADAGQIEGRDEWSAAHDISGVTLTGEIVTARTVGVEHDTVIAFLSSGCEGCGGFWAELGAGPGWARPSGSRLVVVAKGPEAESPARLGELCPAGVDLLMSSEAWRDYEVPGSPYVVVVDGQTGRVKGEGSGQSFSQVGGLIAQAVSDSAARNDSGKPAADREREADVDRILLQAGIAPGHPSLYAGSDGGAVAAAEAR